MQGWGSFLSEGDQVTTSTPMCSDCKGMVTYSQYPVYAATGAMTQTYRGPFCDGLPCSGPQSATATGSFPLTPDILMAPNRFAVVDEKAVDVTANGTLLAVPAQQPNFWMVAGVAAAVLIGGVLLFGGNRRRW